MATTKKATDIIKYRGLGRRKSATARVVLTPGKHEIKINGADVIKYLKSQILLQDIMQPLTITKTENDFIIRVTTVGGGLSGQAGAIRLGIARALLEVNPEFRKPLKDAGMLTRDARVTERKKPGLRKARRAKQFSKR